MALLYRRPPIVRSPVHRRLVGSYGSPASRPSFVLGDLNDYPASEPLAALGEAGLTDLTSQLASMDRYTYVYQGVSQVMDYVLFALSGTISPLIYQVAYINATTPHLILVMQIHLCVAQTTICHWRRSQ